MICRSTAMVATFATATLLGFAGLSGPVASTAQADSPGCVTKGEFRRVDRGMTRRRVARIFDTNGRLASRYGAYATRDYNPCARYASVSVEYKHGRVIHKYGFWA